MLKTSCIFEIWNLFIIWKSCFSLACSDANSIIGNKIAYFRNEYNISVEHNTFGEGVSLIKKSAQLCEELQLTIDHIWSLILVKTSCIFEIWNLFIIWKSCFSLACSDANSIIGNKIAYFRNEYNISVEHNTFGEGVSLIKKSAQLCEELQLTIDHIWSLILVKSNNYSIEDFDLTEINDMISFLTTNWDISFMLVFFYLLCGMFYICMYCICMYT